MAAPSGHAARGADLRSRVHKFAAYSPASRPARRFAVLALRASYRTPRPVVPVRSDLPLLLNRRGFVGCGVEVGVKQGEFSEQLLDAWQGRHLISIDPWFEREPQDYVDVANVPQGVHEGFYIETCKRLARFGSRSTIWRMTSEEAAERIPHHSLDFVYLDARHDFASVTTDLELWHGKVRPGGILAGHDYVDRRLTRGSVRGQVCRQPIRRTPTSSSLGDLRRSALRLLVRGRLAMSGLLLGPGRLRTSIACASTRRRNSVGRDSLTGCPRLS